MPLDKICDDLKIYGLSRTEDLWCGLTLDELNNSIESNKFISIFLIIEDRLIPQIFF